MVDILHKVGIKSSPLGVYNALATREGLSGWWTKDTQWDGKVGSVISFRFGDRGFIDVKVLELDPAKRVLWQVVDGPAVWIGRKISFDLVLEDDLRPCLLQAPGLEGTERVHAPLQHQMGALSDEHQVARRNRGRRALSERRSHLQQR